METLSSIFIVKPYFWVEDHNYLLYPIKPSDIENIVSKYYLVTTEEMEGTWRKREVVVARQMAMVMLYKFTNLSLKDIGVIFGNRDHTTVIHAKKTIQDLCDTDRKIKKDYETLIIKIKRNDTSNKQKHS